MSAPRLLVTFKLVYGVCVVQKLFYFDLVLSVNHFLSSGFCDLLRIFLLSPDYKNMLPCSSGWSSF